MIPYSRVETYQKELNLIKTILKNNPKGMTVSDISREMKINRNSVAKYLDILLISGHAEMITFGPAKVFFPSRRIPIHDMWNFISDYVMILDGDLKVTQINEVFLGFLNVKRTVLLGQHIENLNLPVFTDSEIHTHIQGALNGEEFAEEIRFEVDNNAFYFRLQLIPTAFEDGRQGVTIILTNITEKKRIEQALQGSQLRSVKVLKRRKEK